MRVFDANIALGRRHNKRVSADNVSDIIEAIDYAGVDQALVYSAHANDFGANAGNKILTEMTKNEPRLIPQYVCNPTDNDLESFAQTLKDNDITSVRMFPFSHGYPFVDWIVKSWLNVFSDEQIRLWLPANDLDPVQIYNTIKEFPDTPIVICEVHYKHIPWILPLIRTLKNIYIEISWFYTANGITTLIETIGADRIIFGSRFPHAPIPPQLYSLHHYSLDKHTLESICSGNLQNLLGET